jgi:hypothetical protein
MQCKTRAFCVVLLLENQAAWRIIKEWKGVKAMRKEVRKYMSKIGRKGGRAKTPAKAAAARVNARKGWPVCDCCHKKAQFVTAYDVWTLCDTCLKEAEKNEWAMQPLDDPPHLNEEAERRRP